MTEVAVSTSILLARPRHGLRADYLIIPMTHGQPFGSSKRALGAFHSRPGFGLKVWKSMSENDFFARYRAGSYLTANRAFY
jgi:hypothetical protein